MRTYGQAAAGAGFVLMWSSGFAGATLGTRFAPATTLLFWRFVVATALLAGWWLLVRRRRMSRREIVVHAVIGVLSQGGYLYAIVWSAELGVPAGTAALVASLQPVVGMAAGGVLLGESVTGRQWAGLVTGLGGVALVVSGRLSAGDGVPPFAYLLPFFAMLSLVIATFVERKAAPVSPLADALVVQCTTSTALFTVPALATGTMALPEGAGFWFAVAWVVVLSTFGGYGFYWLNLRYGSVARVSGLLYLTPPTTMLLGYLMFGQALGLAGLAGLLVCSAGVVLVLLPPGRLRRSGVKSITPGVTGRGKDSREQCSAGQA